LSSGGFQESAPPGSGGGSENATSLPLNPLPSASSQESSSDSSEDESTEFSGGWMVIVTSICGTSHTAAVAGPQESSSDNSEDESVK